MMILFELLYVLGEPFFGEVGSGILRCAACSSPVPNDGKATRLSVDIRFFWEYFLFTLYISEKENVDKEANMGIDRGNMRVYWTCEQCGDFYTIFIWT